MARTAIKNDLKKNGVANLYYVARDPYQILHNISHGSYCVKKLHKTDSLNLKSMVYDFYPLPPSLKPCEPVNITDTRYLNQSRASVNNLFKTIIY